MPVAPHVIVELSSPRLVCLKIFREVQFGLVGRLVWAIGGTVGHDEIRGFEV